jgi:hypothetical protein
MFTFNNEDGPNLNLAEREQILQKKLDERREQNHQVVMGIVKPRVSKSTSKCSPCKLPTDETQGDTIHASSSFIQDDNSERSPNTNHASPGFLYKQ